MRMFGKRKPDCGHVDGTLQADSAAAAERCRASLAVVAQIPTGRALRIPGWCRLQVTDTTHRGSCLCRVLPLTRTCTTRTDVGAVWIVPAAPSVHCKWLEAEQQEHMLCELNVREVANEACNVQLWPIVQIPAVASTKRFFFFCIYELVYMFHPIGPVPRRQLGSVRSSDSRS